MSIDLEYAIKTDIRNNPVIRGIDVAQKREFLRTLGLFIVIVAMLLFAAWQHYRVIRSGYDMEELRRHQQEADALNRHLRLQLEMDLRPQEIERRATRQLRMVKPTEDDTLMLERARAASPRSNIVAQSR